MTCYYKPLLMESLLYSYEQGNQQKSFTIQKKLSTYTHDHSVIIRPQTQQYKRPTSKLRQRTVDPQSCNDSSYVDFTIKQMRQSTHNPTQSFYLDKHNTVKKLIEEDKKLIRRRSRRVDISMFLLSDQTKSQYKRQLTNDVTKLLNQQEPLFRKVSTPNSKVDRRVREEFRKKLNKLNALNEELDDVTMPVVSMDDTNKQIQQGVMKYLMRKSDGLAEVTKQVEDVHLLRDSIKQTMRMKSQEDEYSSSIIEPNKYIIGILGGDVQTKETVEDEELENKRHQYWAEDSKGRNRKDLESRRNKMRSKKYGTVFTIPVRNRFIRMKQLILDCVRKMKLMKLTVDELNAERVIMRRPYQREGSYVFFKAVSKNDVDLVTLMLTKCRYFAFDINENLQTSLHICSRKGFTTIAELLLQCGSYPDAVDVCGRTPLYYATINQRTKLVQLLLYNQATPWSKKECPYSLQGQSTEIIKIFKIARRLDMLLIVTPYSTREITWKQYRCLLKE